MSAKYPCEELRKRFARSFLDLTILRMLASDPLWGYKIMTILENGYGLKVGPSVIYPLLDSMESEGLVESGEFFEGKRRRRVYSATDKGIGYLRCLETILEEITG